MITHKTAERIVALHSRIKSLREDMAMLTGPGRKIKGGSVDIVTAEGEGWSNNREKRFTIQSEKARNAAFNLIRSSIEQQLAACIRELHQLDAEVPTP